MKTPAQTKNGIARSGMLSVPAMTRWTKIVPGRFGIMRK